MKLYNSENTVVAESDSIVYDESQRGWLVAGQGLFSDPDKLLSARDPRVTAIEYKMLFTPQERVAIKTSTDPIVQDLYELLNDLRVSHVDLSLLSIQNALFYMETLGILTGERRLQILIGKVT